MSQLNITFEQLRGMIGIRVVYRDVLCEVVEVIEEDLALILADLEYHLGIQPDQHGEAHRKVPKTYTVSILNSDRTEFSSSFLALEPIDTSRQQSASANP